MESPINYRVFYLSLIKQNNKIMPVYKCPNGKFRVGSGKCSIETRAKAQAINRAIKANQSKKS